jgi:hypothetical protein
MKWYKEPKFVVGSIIVPFVIAIVGWIYFNPSTIHNITNAPHNSGVVINGQNGNNVIKLLPPQSPITTNEVSPAASAAATSTRADDKERRFTEKTVGQLMAFYAGRTVLQGDTFMEDEVGKWIKTQGVVQVIQPLGTGAPISVVLIIGKNSVSWTFDGRAWQAKLSAFRDGEIMKITGKIVSGQTGGSLYLQLCELRE